MRFLMSAVALLTVMMPVAAAAQAHPAESGQAAFGAIVEVVRGLEADPDTDWSRVNIERLRQHLIDMDAVTLDAAVVQTPVPGGARMEVTGKGRTREAIVRMAAAHAAQFDTSDTLKVQVEERPDGVVMTVTARDPADRRTEARIRGLGFIGFMASGDHHAPHHAALAGGGTPAGHRH
jgi:hypothetical protein